MLEMSCRCFSFPCTFFFFFDGYRYEVVEKPEAAKDALEQLARFIKDNYEARAAGIVYAFSRREASDVATGLVERGVSAAYYHAGQEVSAPPPRPLHGLSLVTKCSAQLRVNLNMGMYNGVIIHKGVKAVDLLTMVSMLAWELGPSLPPPTSIRNR